MRDALEHLEETVGGWTSVNDNLVWCSKSAGFSNLQMEVTCGISQCGKTECYGMLWACSFFFSGNHCTLSKGFVNQ